MSELRFTEDHEWIRVEADGTATVGITDFAQEQLGDVVYVELPAIGREFARGDDACVVESVKAAADVKLPASGTVVAVNERLTEAPELVNQAPTDAGWFVRIRLADTGELDGLMSEDAYRHFVESSA
ncbi:MAG: glycine cleavage system protein GcvH [Gammaproteobacteria bacterium]|nr:glycine cleavage system protein GcvH [Gammaproteobacteria bacterium]